METRVRKLALVVLFSIAATCLLSPAQSYGHGIPINVFVNSETQQLYTLQNFSTGPFLPFGGPVLSFDPGLGVSNPGNGIPAGATLGLNIMQPLLYSAGLAAQPAATGVEVIITAPTMDDFGNPHTSPVPTYAVDGTSDFLTGMTWGEYDNSVPGWDSHGLYELIDSNAPSGVYGIVMQVTSPGFFPSEPFVATFEWDPFSTVNLEDTTAAITALRAAEEPLAAADFNADGSVNGSDFLIWQNGFGTTTGATRFQGDANEDGIVDGQDFLAWQNQFGSGAGQGSGNAQAAVPEPATIVLIAFAGLCLFCRKFGTRMWRFA